MATTDYPEVQIGTPYGDLWVQIRGNDEIHVRPFRVEGEEHPIVINRVAYTVYGSLWVLPDGRLERSRTVGGYPQYIDGWRVNRSDKFEGGMSDAARDIFHEQIAPLVQKFLQDNPDILRDGELARRLILWEERVNRINDLEREIKTAQEELSLLGDQALSLKEGTPAPTDEGDRCRVCFSPLKRIEERDPKYYRLHCKKCGRDANALPIL